MRNKFNSSVLAPASSILFLASCFLCLFLASCDNYFKNDYSDNSPTSGKLKVAYDEGLELHIKNQALTFESQYPNAHLELFSMSESEAVEAMYKDSCPVIIISRGLSNKEKKAFESKQSFPRYSVVALSGVALITNTATSLNNISYEQVIGLLSQASPIPDSAGNAVSLKVLFDKNNSSVVHYLADTVLKGQKFSANCNTLGSTLESINYVAQHKNTVAFIDFAWLSDVDDSIYIANKDVIKFLHLSKANSNVFEYPHQSSFKLGTYAFTRKVYMYHKAGEFSLAKGFESFVAGPKGQLTFLKQGLMPARQGERNVKINTKPLNAE
jgi:phosphate transport system substrate-binding protein